MEKGTKMKFVVYHLIGGKWTPSENVIDAPSRKQAMAQVKTTQGYKAGIVKVRAA